MRAAVIDRFGSPDVLVEREVQDPVAGRSQVRIKVAAAGLNPLDYRIRRDELRGLVRSEFPMILGNDVSGHVESLVKESLVSSSVMR